MSYIFFALLAALAFAIGALINKFASKHAIHDWKKLWVYFVGTYSLIAVVLTPFISTITWPKEALAEIILNSFFFLLGVAFWMMSILRIDASVATPLYQTQGVAIAILAFLFLGERFPLASYIWLAVIIIGCVIVSLDEKLRLNSFFSRGVMIMILANILFAVSNLWVGLSLRTQTNGNIMFWGTVTNLIFLSLFLLIRRPDIRISFNAYKPMVPAGVVQFIGVVCILTAYQQNITLSAVLSLLSSPIVFVVTFFTSKFFPQLLEHHSPKVYAIRAIGLVIILFAAIKLSLG